MPRTHPDRLDEAFLRTSGVRGGQTGDADDLVALPRDHPRRPREARDPLSRRTTRFFVQRRDQRVRRVRHGREPSRPEILPLGGPQKIDLDRRTATGPDCRWACWVHRFPLNAAADSADKTTAETSSPPARSRMCPAPTHRPGWYDRHAAGSGPALCTRSTPPNTPDTGGVCVQARDRARIGLRRPSGPGCPVCRRRRAAESTCRVAARRRGGRRRPRPRAPRPRSR